MARVKKSASPVITVFGGSDAVPSAVLVIPSTTAIRVKQVMHKIIAGAKESTVRSNTILRLLATLPPPASSLPPTLMERSGKAACCAIASVEATTVIAMSATMWMIVIMSLHIVLTHITTH
jgi:hypothetical protein